MDNCYVVAGLGNPGRQYENTRHNAGFDTLDYFCAKTGISLNKIKHKAIIGEGTVEGKHIIAVKPQTYMNLSGESIREVLEYYKIPPERLIVIYDDVDIELGSIRIRPSGSAGSHNGMKSIIYCLETDQFPRVRIGIERPPKEWDMKDYVLGKFDEEQRKLLNKAIEIAYEALMTILRKDIQTAMNLFNKRQVRNESND